MHLTTRGKAGHPPDVLCVRDLAESALLDRAGHLAGLGGTSRRPLRLVPVRYGHPCLRSLLYLPSVRLFLSGEDPADGSPTRRRKSRNRRRARTRRERSKHRDAAQSPPDCPVAGAERARTIPLAQDGPRVAREFSHPERTPEPWPIRRAEAAAEREWPVTLSMPPACNCNLCRGAPPENLPPARPSGRGYVHANRKVRPRRRLVSPRSREMPGAKGPSGTTSWGKRGPGPAPAELAPGINPYCRDRCGRVTSGRWP